MKTSQPFHLAVVAVVLIVAATTSTATRPKPASPVFDATPPAALSTPVAAATPAATVTPKEPEHLEPELYRAIEQAEQELTGSSEGYWPVNFSLVDTETGRYATVGTKYFGSGKRMWLMEQSRSAAEWKTLGSASRMGEDNNGPITAEEKHKLGVEKLPPGVWKALGEAPDHFFDSDLDTENAAYNGPASSPIRTQTVI